MTKEKKFYNALKDVFVGEKIEGESGYINLMKIKSGYFEKGVFPKLKEDIENALKDFQDFREELFDKLYTFFSRYLSRSGSIYFNYTPLHQNVYDKVYTDDKDVILFWKTRMLYYVKTDRIFRNLKTEIVKEKSKVKTQKSKVETEKFKFYFDVSKLEHKKATEKRELIYEFKEIQKDGTIVFEVFYTEKGRKTKTEQIIKELKKHDIKITTDTLERAFKVFERQSEIDYFINKNAEEFLKEQFDLWLYQYVFKEKSEWTEKRIKELQILKDIAYKIIRFISQFENELVKIWNKPKFVFNSNYVITLDRIFGKEKSKVKSQRSKVRNESVIEKILKHPDFKEQVREWKELGIIDEKISEKDLQREILKKDLTGKNLNEKYKFLPIDTKYFKDLEIEILSLFDNLDESLDGWLIKSENYQALNTILPKFREKVQTIYIDPPFNKEQDADYFYSVKYKDSTWITMLENRLKIAKDLLKDTGSIFVRCDYNGNMYVRLLMNEVFGEENFRNEIIINRFQKASKGLTNTTESLFFYSATENLKMIPLKRPRVCIYCKQQVPLRWTWAHSAGEGKEPRYFIVDGKKVLLYPPKGRHWTNSQEEIDKLQAKGRIRINKNLSYIDIHGNRINFIPEKLQSEDINIDNNWTDIPGYVFGVFSPWKFQTENSEILLKRVIESTSNQGDLVMDFFLGSGTTTAVAHKLKRKWIGIEVGEHFWTVVLPRMKKVLFFDKSGISKEKDVKEKYNEKNAGGFFKYYELEQYEDVLRKAKYKDSDLFENPNEDVYNRYIFMKDPKMLECLEIDYEKNKVKVDFSKLYSKEKDGKEIDVVETISNVLGKWIKKVKSKKSKVKSVIFEDGEEIDIENLDYRIIKSLIWW